MSIQGQDRYCFQRIQSAPPTEIFSYCMIVMVGLYMGGGGDHYSAIVEHRGIDKESQKVCDSTDSTNVKNKVPNEHHSNTNSTNELQLDESESSGKGMGDLRQNISDVCGKFGDEFDCDEGGYFDEFGDVINCDRASGFSSDVNVAETSNGNQEIHLTQDSEQANEGNDLTQIDLTQEIPQTNEDHSITNDHDSIASTNKTKTVDTDVEIVSDPCDIEDGIDIPETYKREKREKETQTQKEMHQLREICSYGFCTCGRNTMGFRP